MNDSLLRSSVSLITGLQTPDGAYPASPTFSAYQGYCWFRDGSFITDAMSSVGEVDSAEAFFTWCDRVVLRHQDRIEAAIDAACQGRPLPDSQMLPARFTFDGDIGGDDWWDFQLDGYGTWLWAVVEHCRRHDRDHGRWKQSINLTAEYLVSSWKRPCFDWWEEHCEQVHVSTLGCIAAGLRAVSVSGVLGTASSAKCGGVADEILAMITIQGVRDGSLVKWLGSDCVDGSLSALLSPLAIIDPLSPVGQETIRRIEADLVVDHGVYRFREDVFYGGGRWPLLSCFLGLAKSACGVHEQAHEYLEWAMGTATDQGLLPEQVDGGELLYPEHKQDWINRWGPVATPLLWSHAMVLRLASELGDNIANKSGGRS